MIDWHIKARAMREGGAKVKDIAAALDKKISAVSQALNVYCGTKVKCPIHHRGGKPMADWHIRARKMREAGATTKAIAEALGKKHSAVRQALSAHNGRAAVKCSIDHNRGARTWTSDRISDFTALWLDGTPTAEMARKFNLAHEANVSGLAIQFRLPPRLEQYEWTPDLENELRRLWTKRRYRKASRKPFHLREIARHFDTTPSIIVKAARRLGLPLRQLTHVKWTAAQDRKLRRLWPDYDISVDQIALQLGHTKPGILNRRQKLGLAPRRPRDNCRISLHAWEGMSKEERQRIPEWRMPIRPWALVKTYKRRKRLRPENLF